MEKLKKEHDKLNTQLDSQVNKYDQQRIELEAHKNRTKSLNEEHQMLKKMKEKKDKDFYDLTITEGELRNENRRLTKENKSHHLNNLKLTNERDHTLNAKKEAEHAKNITTSGVNALTREIEYLRKTADNEKTDILNLIRDRDMMSKYIRKAEDINEKNKQEIIKLNAKVASLNEQSRQKAENIASLISQLFKLEKERDKAAQDAQKHSNTVT